MNDRDLDRDLEEIAKQTKELERQLAETKAIQEQIKEKHFSGILRKLGSDASKAAVELEGENGVSLLLQAADELAGEESLLGFHSAPFRARLEMELDLLVRAKQGKRPYFEGDPNYKELLACIWKSLQEEEANLAGNRRKFRGFAIQRKFLVSAERYEELKGEVIEHAITGMDPMQVAVVDGIHNLDGFKIS